MIFNWARQLWSWKFIEHVAFRVPHPCWRVMAGRVPVPRPWYMYYTHGKRGRCAKALGRRRDATLSGVHVSRASRALSQLSHGEIISQCSSFHPRLCVTLVYHAAEESRDSQNGRETATLIPSRNPRQGKLNRLRLFPSISNSPRTDWM